MVLKFKSISHVSICIFALLLLLHWGAFSHAANYTYSVASPNQDRMPLLMPGDFEELHLVSWRVEEGEPDPHNPLVMPKYPWDSGGVMAHGTILRDPYDGLWKAWLISTPPETTLEELDGIHEEERRLTYLESEDGVHWDRPMLPYVSWPGYEKTNILLSHESGGASTYASVLLDSSNQEHPYEMFIMRGAHGGVEYKNPDKTSPLGKGEGIYRYRSKDGTDWTPVEGPLGNAPSDVLYVYQKTDGSYIGYYKTGIEPPDFARVIPYDNNHSNTLRSVFYTASPDGSNWGDVTLVMTADWRDPNHQQFMEINPVQVPGGYIGFVTVYDAITQVNYLQLAISRDGIDWWTVARRPTLPNPPLGDYGGGMIWQVKNPIVQDDDLHVYYAGVQGLHGEIFDTRHEPRKEARGITTIAKDTPTLPFNSALCRATWDFHRLYALVPSAGGPTRGVAVTTPQECAGKSLWVNANALYRGHLEVALLDSAGNEIPGYSREDCKTITGDHYELELEWRGGTTAPPDAQKVKFYLINAFLYGFEWRK